MPKRVIILGSTGSIGRSALSVADNLPGEFEIVGLAANSSCERLVEQVEKYHPKIAVLADPSAADRASDQLKKTSPTTQLLTGPEALVRLVKEADADFDRIAAAQFEGLKISGEMLLGILWLIEPPRTDPAAGAST